MLKNLFMILVLVFGLVSISMACSFPQGSMLDTAQSINTNSHVQSTQAMHVENDGLVSSVCADALNLGSKIASLDKAIDSTTSDRQRIAMSAKLDYLLRLQSKRIERSIKKATYHINSPPSLANQ